MSETRDVSARLDRLGETHAAATVIGLLPEEANHARLDAGWAVLQATPALIAAVRAVLALADADEERAKVCRDAQARARSIGEEDYYDRMAQVGEQSADRLRTAVAAALGAEVAA